MKGKFKMTLYKFLKMEQWQQKKMLSQIVERAENANQNEWIDGTKLPMKCGYYPVICQYGKHISTRRKGVMRWNGEAWADCYDNEKTTSNRYSAYDVIKWVDDCDCGVKA